MTKGKTLSFVAIIAGIMLMSFIHGNEKKAVSKDFKKKFALVPLGYVSVNGERAQVGDFFICRTEVSNTDYNAFLADVKLSGNRQLMDLVQPDTKQWEVICSNKALVTRYHTQKIYADYPVVNVSYEAAVEYCKWLTEKTNKESSGNVTYEFRLPTRAEWIRAAEGNIHNVAYSWGGPEAYNSKGELLCQCNRTTAHKGLFDMMTYTCPTVSYEANSIGLYNMNGNVAEMISEKGIAVGGSWASKDSEVKNESTMSYQAPSPLIGFRPLVVVTGN